MRKWKVLQLLGIFMLLVGVAVRVSTGEIYGTGLAMLGALLYAVGRIAAWMRSDQP